MMQNQQIDRPTQSSGYEPNAVIPCLCSSADGEELPLPLQFPETLSAESKAMQARIAALQEAEQNAEKAIMNAKAKADKVLATKAHPPSTVPMRCLSAIPLVPWAGPPARLQVHENLTLGAPLLATPSVTPLSVASSQGGLDRIL